MQISVIKEENINEQRVASTPDVVKLLERLGVEILIEKNAGDLSGYSNELYESVGAKIVDRNACLQSDICLCVRLPSKNDINQIVSVVNFRTCNRPSLRVRRHHRRRGNNQE